MNKKSILILLVLFSMGFSRASYAHKVTIAPDLIFSTAFNRGEAKISKGAIEEKDSVMKRRRHIRRKKTRRPMRGK
ncbi:MAG: hypothetical protein CMP89_10150 [Gammaproteobacteria bacterium]|nr:hypothetical protein [Gammaproteobacteria bacterium]